MISEFFYRLTAMQAVALPALSVAVYSSAIELPGPDPVVRGIPSPTDPPEGLPGAPDTTATRETGGDSRW